MNKQFYTIDEFSHEGKLMKDEILDTIQRFEIPVPTFINGNLQFDKKLMKRINTAYWTPKAYMRYLENRKTQDVIKLAKQAEKKAKQAAKEEKKKISLDRKRLREKLYRRKIRAIDKLSSQEQQRIAEIEQRIAKLNRTEEEKSAMMALLIKSFRPSYTWYPRAVS